MLEQIPLVWNPCSQPESPSTPGVLLNCSFTSSSLTSHSVAQKLCWWSKGREKTKVRGSGTTATLCLDSAGASVNKTGRTTSAGSAADVQLVGTSGNKMELFVVVFVECLSIGDWIPPESKLFVKCWVFFVVVVVEERGGKKNTAVSG